MSRRRSQFDLQDESNGAHRHGCGGHRHSRGEHRRNVFLIIVFLLIGIAFFNRNDNHTINAESARLPVHLAAVEQGSFNDVVVASGETIRKDLVVYSGNVTIEGGGVVKGDLVLFSGNAEIQSGGVVEGDLTVWSGNVQIDGLLEGDLAALSGNVTLGEGAEVEGDISTFSGNIHRGRGARVDGDVVSGISKGVPFFRQGAFAPPIAPDAPAMPDLTDELEAPVAPVAPTRPFETGPSFAGRIAGVIGRLFLGVFVTLAITLLSIGVFSLRPQSITAAYYRMREELTRSFALGITVNAALYIAALALFAVGWCLAPLGAMAMVTLVLFTLLGWTVGARMLGENLVARFASDHAREQKPVMEVAVGAFVLAAALSLLAAFGGFGWFFRILAVVIAAPGLGAFLMPWFDKYRTRKVEDLTSPGTTGGGGATSGASGGGPSGGNNGGGGGGMPVAPTRGGGPGGAGAAPFGTRYPMPTAPVAPAAPTQPAAPAAYAPFAPVAPAAPAASATPAATLDAVETPDASATTGNREAANEWVLEPPVSLQQPPESSTAPYHLELPEQPARPQGTPGISVEDLVAAAAADAAAAEERARLAGSASAASAPVDVSVGDDFTRIVGLGKSSERKLKGAGITTYTQLAALPVEMVANILGVPVEEVIEDEVVKQAHTLAA